MGIGLRRVLTGGRPIPDHLGGSLERHERNVAGDASDWPCVRVQSVIAVGGLTMAIGARNPFTFAGADAHTLAENLVLFAAVAVDADEIGAPHMNIESLGWVRQSSVEIAVLHRVATAD